MRTIAVFIFTDAADATVYATDTEACEARAEACEQNDESADNYPIEVVDIPADDYCRLGDVDDLTFELWHVDGLTHFFTGSLLECVGYMRLTVQHARIVKSDLSTFERSRIWPVKEPENVDEVFVNLYGTTLYGTAYATKEEALEHASEDARAIAVRFVKA